MDFFTKYMEFVDLDNQEAPAVYHRWTLASIIGTLLGRQFYLPFGKAVIYPNQFIMLMGTPGARKGSAMGIGRDLLRGAGYNRFSASRTSLERFLIDMKPFDIDPSMEVADVEALVMDAPSESYIYAGEFVDFIEPKDIRFINLLTNLWDNLPEYTHPKVQGKSVTVHKPTVNLFGGSTPQTFTIAFPPEIIGTGFTSRMLLIHSEPTGKKISWPGDIDPLRLQQLILHLKDIRDNIKGQAEFSDAARSLVSNIYSNEIHIDDNRFGFYQQRRHTHLLKLSLVLAAGNLSRIVEKSHVLWANTMLAAAERKMPLALGEFGKSKNSEVANEILQWLTKKDRPVNANEIYKAVSRSITRIEELTHIINNLKIAEKIKVVNIKGKMGYVTNHVEAPKWNEAYMDLDWLTAEEKA